MLRALLFDLDGTLLPLNQEEFMRNYFRALVPAVAPFVDKDVAIAQIMACTEKMIHNEEPQWTNEQVFWESFSAVSAAPLAPLKQATDEFYRTRFAHLQSASQRTPQAREVCNLANEKGYVLVLATNPVFPEIAIRHRMAWAGIEDVPFTLVTTMENMHYCKPSPKYFMEIAEKIGVSPEECMMIGNDVQEDGVAGKSGMETFLVTDNLLDRGEPVREFTHQGNLTELLEFVQGIPALTSTQRG
ncbi:HAD family hydrolase [Alicyclobacillaceae bacterium I2511]|nr:HAD family hydrolase [Alicyclobacillaceae bacterium I2511]